jgi:hypothetical protein
MVCMILSQTFLRISWEANQLFLHSLEQEEDVWCEVRQKEGAQPRMDLPVGQPVFDSDGSVH